MEPPSPIVLFLLEPYERGIMVSVQLVTQIIQRFPILIIQNSWTKCEAQGASGF